MRVAVCPVLCSTTKDHPHVRITVDTKGTIIEAGVATIRLERQGSRGSCLPGASQERVPINAP